MKQLGNFEGRREAGSQISITKAGDGLSDALQVDPVAYSTGEEVFVQAAPATAGGPHGQ